MRSSWPVAFFFQQGFGKPLNLISKTPQATIITNPILSDCYDHSEIFGGGAGPDTLMLDISGVGEFRSSALTWRE